VLVAILKKLILFSKIFPCWQRSIHMGIWK